MPLCGGRCIKYGLSLGCTVPVDVFLDLSVKFGAGLKRFMGLTRTGDPRKLYIDNEVPISKDMFKVHDDILAWYDSKDWVRPRVETDPRVKRVQGLLNVAAIIAGPDTDSAVVARFPEKLRFE